ncbi:MAG: 50S ribosome-binding GTPase [Phycisphaerales bacterium]|jgi:tRNA modification GTPase|nr:50S ribosome-binding GTPase [Phycisphaerales bacterium]
MTPGDTIIACSTGASRAARALVRLSGPDVPNVARAIAGEIAPRTGVAGVVRVRDAESDGVFHELPVLCVRFAAPASYTGEEMLELSLPGNPALVERVIDAIIRGVNGAGLNGGGSNRAAAPSCIRRAEPGEFSARAFLHGKLSLEQAEGVAGIIAARTSDQLAAADRLLRGATGERYRAWTDELATLLALVEAGIDFTDQEDVVAIAPAELARRVRAIGDAIARELGATRGRAAPGALPVVLIVGEPNAGKSTLFNALLGVRRAIESPERGTTRDVLREELDLGAHIPGAGRVMLCDSAGLDESIATGPSEHAAQAATRGALAEADVVVWCDPSGGFACDATQGIGHPASGIGEDTSSPALGADRGEREFSEGMIDVRAETPVIRVCTKGDRGNSLAVSSRTVREGMTEGIGHRASGISVGATSPAPGTSGAPIPVCALDGWNLDLLRRAIADAAGVGGCEGLAVARHAAALRAAHANLARLVGGIDPRVRALSNPEIVAESLREAIDHLGAISGRLTTEDILGKVFSTFCVGK